MSLPIGEAVDAAHFSMGAKGMLLLDTQTTLSGCIFDCLRSQKGSVAHAGFNHDGGGNPLATPLLHSAA